MEPAVIPAAQPLRTDIEDGKKMVNKYVLDCVVGRGVHGTVYKCHEHLKKDTIFVRGIPTFLDSC